MQDHPLVGFGQRELLANFFGIESFDVTEQNHRPWSRREITNRLFQHSLGFLTHKLSLWCAVVPLGGWRQPVTIWGKLRQEFIRFLWQLDRQISEQPGPSFPLTPRFGSVYQDPKQPGFDAAAVFETFDTL